MTDLLMLDSIYVSEFQGLTFDALAGYVGGSWPDFNPICQAYPQLAQAGRVLSYAVNASEDAEAADCEIGDLSVGEVSPWIDRQLKRGVWRPAVYANLSRWQNEGLWDATAHYGAGIRRIAADWTYTPGISVSGYDGQQWTDHYNGRNIDGNTVKNDFFSGAVHPPVVNPQHYDWFPTGPFYSFRWGNLNEQKIVEEYDGARQHMDKYGNPGGYLDKLEAQLHWLAQRALSMAKYQNPNKDGTPSWQLFHRGWRFQQLIHRSQGHKFV